ncbi:hypothetical protein FVEG_00161 [Fusarium verticillioides 7600]|uniref:Uncharacterized protein n=1 Tax=Gibberella moniliformis (strain M3125 / FGSC 7600) TaxID=334819 RepID=W7LKC4_GIBM7|nr:hypothetical protein FVEG_00161 [Fusarium verticillioides 7600]EWG35985.1 hypothetical protein FVEG_00161 [Fusarium verticillioides 7600]
MNLSTITQQWIDQNPMRNTIRTMRKTGIHQWGFVIYRATYGDDDLWDRYLAALKENIRENLQRNKCHDLLDQYAHWEVVCMEAGGNGKTDVRRLFAAWCAEQTDRFAEQPSLTPPRFTHCLYVNEECLSTLEAHEEARLKRKVPGLGPPLPPLVAVVIDGGYSPPSRGWGLASRQEFPPVEGCSDKYVGWEYYNVVYIPLLYDKLHNQRLDDEPDYVRPPAIAPLGNLSMEERS